MKKEDKPRKVMPEPKSRTTEKKSPPKKATTTEAASKKNASGRRRVVLSVDAEPGSKVYVAGSFNDWSPKKHSMTEKVGSGRFERQIYADPGPLEYKFVINGEWVIDARCSAWVPNAMGSLNSVIEVR